MTSGPPVQAARTPGVPAPHVTTAGPRVRCGVAPQGGATPRRRAPARGAGQTTTNTRAAMAKPMTPMAVSMTVHVRSVVLTSMSKNRPTSQNPESFT